MCAPKRRVYAGFFLLPGLYLRSFSIICFQGILLRREASGPYGAVLVTVVTAAAVSELTRAD